MKNLTNKLLVPLAIAVFAMLSLGAYVIGSFSHQGTMVYITKDAKRIQEINLSLTDTPYTLDMGTNKILVENDGVTMTWADCPDRHCVHTGKISKENESIVCLPNRIMVEIKGNREKVDAVAGAR